MIDLLVVGDVGIDTYYLLDKEDASVHHVGNEKECELCFDMSEKIPVEQLEKTVGGNAANVAIGASRLGLKTALVSNVGRDEDGRSILCKLEKEDVELDYIKQSGKTNQTAALIYKGKRTLLVHHEDRKYSFDVSAPARWMYLTSTNIGGKNMNESIVGYVNKHNTKLVFSPGTLQRHAGANIYKNILEICDLIVLNKEEAIDYCGGDNEDIKTLLRKLLEFGPSRAVITDETRGSYGIDENENIYFSDTCKSNTVDNTGAGDGYAVALTVALAKGKTLAEAMAWGSANAASVVEHIGPQQGLLSLPRLMKLVERCKINVNEL